MSQKAPVGHSRSTPAKQKQFDLITRTICASHKLNNSGRFYYMDMNAGPGAVNNQPGSPLVFMRQAEETLGGQYSAFLVERDRNTFHSLCRQVENTVQNGAVFTLFGDNVQRLKAIAQEVHDQNGLIYCDPCGVAIPFKQLGEEFANADGIDVLANCAVNAFRRAGKDERQLTDLVHQLRKKYVFVSRPRDSRWEWVFIYATSKPRWSLFQKLEEIGFSIYSEDKIKPVNQSPKGLAVSSERPVNTTGHGRVYLKVAEALRENPRSTNKSIAKAVGCSMSYVYYSRKLFGKKKKKEHNHKTASAGYGDTRKQIDAEVKKNPNSSNISIARAVGCSHTYVATILNKLGLRSVRKQSVIRLTDKDVRDIRAKYRPGNSKPANSDLCKKYNISHNTMYKAAIGLNYSWVK